MDAAKKALFTLSSLIITVLLAIVTIQNWSVPVSLNFFGQQLSSFILGPILLGSYLIGLVSALLKFLSVHQEMRSEIKQFELRKEKAEVKAETNTDLVRTLENKIQTLEKALEQALASAVKER